MIETISKFLESLGLFKYREVVLVRPAPLECPDFQRLIFKAGGSIGIEAAGLIRFPPSKSVAVLGLLDSEGIEYRPASLPASSPPYFSSLEWAAIMGEMESLNNGRSLRSRRME